MVRSMRGDVWLPEEDNLLRHCVEQRMKDKDIGLLMPNRTDRAIKTRRKILGLQFYNVSRFTDEDKAYIEKAFHEHKLMDEIAATLGRSVGTIHQYIFHNGLHRDARKTILAKRYGADVLKVSDDPEQIKQIMAQIEAKEKLAKEAQQQEHNETVLNEMVASIESGTPRKEAFRVARLKGLTLDQIGSKVGITRERVRQITDYLNSADYAAQRAYFPIKPCIVTCKMCGNDFTVNRQGAFRYCDTCSPKAQAATLERNKAAARAYAKAHYATPEGKAQRAKYSRDYYKKTREAKLLAKLGQLEPDALQRILTQVKVNDGTESGSSDNGRSGGGGSP